MKARSRNCINLHDLFITGIFLVIGVYFIQNFINTQLTDHSIYSHSKIAQK